LIAYANPAVYLSHPLEVVQLNFFDNLKIVGWCLKHRRRLVQFSTCEVYGKTGGRATTFREDASDCVLGPVCNHRWIYACSKQLLERILHAHGLKGELEYTIIRPFNFVGPLIDYLIDNPTDGNPRVFSHFMSALLHDWPMRLVDGGHARRSYTYIADAVEALLLILEHRDAARNQILNVGSPHNETTIRDFARRMREIYAELTGKPCTTPVVDVSGREFYGEGYEDCDRRIPDVSKLTALGWTPKHDLDATLRLTMQFHIDHHEHLRQKTPAYRLLVGDGERPVVDGVLKAAGRNG
ncbi:MAG TPA: NAD-dependent epimerase/dehydratase family protein, partial [Planctomycetota bacterium]|nr:NAD-dependent epimerase/dehydratase family protein [Planctomycetota bacterium]